MATCSQKKIAAAWAVCRTNTSMAAERTPVKYLTRRQNWRRGIRKESRFERLIAKLRAREPASFVRLGQILDGGPIGDDDQPVGDPDVALALPGAEVLVDALTRRADDVARSE